MVERRVVAFARLEHDERSGESPAKLPFLLDVTVIDERARARRSEPRLERIARRDRRRVRRAAPLNPATPSK